MHSDCIQPDEVSSAARITAAHRADLIVTRQTSAFVLKMDEAFFECQVE